MGGKQGREEQRNSGAAGPSASCSRRSIAHRELRSLEGVVWESELGLLRTLDASYNKLSDGSLAPLEACESLEALILDHNRFQCPALPLLPKLRFLSLASNKISDMEQVLGTLRANAPELRQLSLLSNPCCPDFEVQAKQPHRYLAYRLFVVGHLPKLGRLDLQEVTENEREAADDLLSRISQGVTSLELELSDAPRRRKDSLLRKDSTMTNPRPKKEQTTEEGSPEKQRRSHKEKKEKKKKKEKRESREKKKAHADPVAEVAERVVTEEEEVAKAGEEEEEADIATADIATVADTVSGSHEEGPSERSEPQSRPLPHLNQLVRQKSDWAEQPPPPPPPPVWSDDEEGRTGRAKVKVPRPGHWSDDSSESSSDAELDRVLEKATSRRVLIEKPATPPPPPPQQPLPQHYGPHTTVPPPPPPPPTVSRRSVVTGGSSAQNDGWSSDEDC
eukprot:Hpha_TRINITY_DN14266_c0_g1::TRINITY_DN14266_c0_g1_i1::g.22168::m.22168